ncbi:4'-phosphopantetheinyl transferase superfamily protein [Cryobacterium sp. PH31-O1]|uniref:4'-phosphopantetheinyl transferase family protein n=1 Tax=Cryobacterium sp. PH31-O1 TaxID=3046306 RepID=UPI0024B8AE20|nr:4'-phosphopantetheinyl transferase superfamily protein [Cryobacterium sp. PH31-O1]MDJ0338286.1 4'-phosphopantetheinyl transferase superfamily protein [Cryobacterium sp. PH31-O1]
MPSADVYLFLAPRAPLPQTDRAELAAAVARVCPESGPVIIEQRCERCGGAHGRPRVLRPPGVFVSLSRADQTVAVAVSLIGPIGVDIESVSAVHRAGFDDVAFNELERSALQALPGRDRDRARAFLWTSKEAALKLSGEGLAVDPRELTVALAQEGASTRLSWPGAALDVDRVHLAGFDAGPGLVGMLAVLGAQGPRIVLRPQP